MLSNSHTVFHISHHKGTHHFCNGSWLPTDGDRRRRIVVDAKRFFCDMFHDCCRTDPAIMGAVLVYTGFHTYLMFFCVPNV
jgi:hypothetical protein